MADTSTLITDLKIVRALIQQGWTQGTYAKNGKNQSCFPRDPHAVSWCLLGACARTRNEINTTFVLQAILRRRGVNPLLSAWNDAEHRTKQEVLDLINEAIAEAHLNV